jgi:hypothetical protein
MVAPPDDSIPEGAVRKPPLPPVRGTSHHLKDGAYVFESTVQQPTLCCLADHTHSGGRFQTCPHYGVLMHQTMGSTRALHHTGQRPALPGAMRTRSPTVVAPIIPVTACIVGAGFKPAPTPHHGVLMRQTMGSTRALHHTGQRPALPGAMRTRSPAVVAPIIPVTACIEGAGFKPAPTMAC